MLVCMIKGLLGQYSEKNTVIDKLDSRLKIIFTFIFSITVYSIKEYEYQKLTEVSLFILVVLVIALIDLRQLIFNLRPFIYIYFFIVAMYYLFSRDKMIYGIVSLWKFTLLIITGIILTATTTLGDLVKGIEKILFPLKYIKLNPRNIALMLSITIRFIPLFFLYSRKVKEAQMSRLSNFRKLRNIRIFLIKLISRMLNSAITLSDSITSRCYDVKNRAYTDFRQLKITKKDYVACILFILFIAGILLPK